MAKIKCNHCKAKFIYKSKSGKLVDRNTLLARYSIKSIEGKHYCSSCLDTISKYMLKKEKPDKNV